MNRVKAGAAFCMLLLGCPTQMRLPSPSERALLSWGFDVERASAAQLEVAVEESRSLAEEFPGQSEVLELALRTHLAMGEVAEGGERLALFSDGKQLGRQCLRLNGAWKVMEELAGGRITASSLRRLEQEDLQCLRLLVANWLRWIEDAGHSATVDLPMVGLLAERSLEIATALDSVDWRDHWALGMTIGLSRPTEASMANADFHFLRAQDLAPQVATPSVDRIQAWARIGVNTETLVQELVALGKADFPIHDNAPYSAQNRHALKRAIGLLAQLRLKSE